jgi:hypothetical protein
MENTLKIPKIPRKFHEAHCVVWTSLGPLPRWVPGPTTRWAPGTTRLALHGTCWRGAQGLRRRSTRLGSCTCPALYGRLLAYSASTLSLLRLVTLPPGLYKARHGPFSSINSSHGVQLHQPVIVPYQSRATQHTGRRVLRTSRPEPV